MNDTNNILTIYVGLILLLFITNLYLVNKVYKEFYLYKHTREVIEQESNTIYKQTYWSA